MSDAGHNSGSNRIAVHPILGEDVRRGTARLLLDGRPMTALTGDTIAAALRAHGIVIHRGMPDTDAPRGVFCGVGRCPDCMMTVNGVLNVRACVTPAQDGMVVETQHGHGLWNGVSDAND